MGTYTIFSPEESVPIQAFPDKMRFVGTNRLIIHQNFDTLRYFETHASNRVVFRGSAVSTEPASELDQWFKDFDISTEGDAVYVARGLRIMSRYDLLDTTPWIAYDPDEDLQPVPGTEPQVNGILVGIEEPVETVPPIVINHEPAPDAVDVAQDVTIRFQVVDRPEENASGVRKSRLRVQISGSTQPVFQEPGTPDGSWFSDEYNNASAQCVETVDPSIQEWYAFQLKRNTPFTDGETITITVSGEDWYNNPFSVSWSFTIVGIPPYLKWSIPPDGALNVPPSTQVSLCLADDREGIDLTTVQLEIAGSTIYDGTLVTQEEGTWPRGITGNVYGGTISGTPNELICTFQPHAFPEGAVIAVHVYCQDLIGGELDTTISFTIRVAATVITPTTLSYSAVAQDTAMDGKKPIYGYSEVLQAVRSILEGSFDLSFTATAAQASVFSQLSGLLTFTLFTNPRALYYVIFLSVQEVFTLIDRLKKKLGQLSVALMRYSLQRARELSTDTARETAEELRAFSESLQDTSATLTGLHPVDGLSALDQLMHEYSSAAAKASAEELRAHITALCPGAIEDLTELYQWIERIRLFIYTYKESQVVHEHMRHITTDVAKVLDTITTQLGAGSDLRMLERDAVLLVVAARTVLSRLLSSLLPERPIYSGNHGLLTTRDLVYFYETGAYLVSQVGPFDLPAAQTMTLALGETVSRKLALPVNTRAEVRSGELRKSATAIIYEPLAATIPFVVPAPYSNVLLVYTLSAGDVFVSLSGLVLYVARQRITVRAACRYTDEAPGMQVYFLLVDQTFTNTTIGYNESLGEGVLVDSTGKRAVVEVLVYAGGALEGLGVDANLIPVVQGYSNYAHINIFMSYNDLALLADAAPTSASDVELFEARGFLFTSDLFADHYVGEMQMVTLYHIMAALEVLPVYRKSTDAWIPRSPASDGEPYVLLRHITTISTSGIQLKHTRDTYALSVTPGTVIYPAPTEVDVLPGFDRGFIQSQPSGAFTLAEPLSDYTLQLFLRFDAALELPLVLEDGTQIAPDISRYATSMSCRGTVANITHVSGPFEEAGALKMRGAYLRSTGNMAPGAHDGYESNNEFSAMTVLMQVRVDETITDGTIENPAYVPLFTIGPEGEDADPDCGYFSAILLWSYGDSRCELLTAIRDPQYDPSALWMHRYHFSAEEFHERWLGKFRQLCFLYHGSGTLRLLVDGDAPLDVADTSASFFPPTISLAVSGSTGSRFDLGRFHGASAFLSTRYASFGDVLVLRRMLSRNEVLRQLVQALPPVPMAYKEYDGSYTNQFRMDTARFWNHLGVSDITSYGTLPNGLLHIETATEELTVPLPITTPSLRMPDLVRVLQRSYGETHGQSFNFELGASARLFKILTSEIEDAEGGHYTLAELVESGEIAPGCRIFMSPETPNLLDPARTLSSSLRTVKVHSTVGSQMYIEATEAGYLTTTEALPIVSRNEQLQLWNGQTYLSLHFIILNPRSGKVYHGFPLQLGGGQLWVKSVARGPGAQVAVDKCPMVGFNADVTSQGQYVTVDEIMAAVHTTQFGTLVAQGIPDAALTPDVRKYVTINLNSVVQKIPVFTDLTGATLTQRIVRSMESYCRAQGLPLTATELTTGGFALTHLWGREESPSLIVTGSEDEHDSTGQVFGLSSYQLPHEVLWDETYGIMFATRVSEGRLVLQTLYREEQAIIRVMGVNPLGLVSPEATDGNREGATRFCAYRTIDRRGFQNLAMLGVLPGDILNVAGNEAAIKSTAHPFVALETELPYTGDLTTFVIYNKYARRYATLSTQLLTLFRTIFRRGETQIELDQDRTQQRSVTLYYNLAQGSLDDLETALYNALTTTQITDVDHARAYIKYLKTSLAALENVLNQYQVEAVPVVDLLMSLLGDEGLDHIRRGLLRSDVSVLTNMTEETANAMNQLLSSIRSAIAGML